MQCREAKSPAVGWRYGKIEDAMIGRASLLIVAFAVGVAAASFVPGFTESVRKAVGLAAGRGVAEVRQDVTSGTEAKKPNAEPADDQEKVKLTDEQIAAAHIDLVAARGGTLARRLTVPGTILPHADRIAHVSVKLSGTVAELRKKLGDPVAKDEVLAILESREVADAKSEFLARKTSHDLQQTLFNRAKMLWEGKAATENDYLRARATAEDARIKMEVARQKLAALGLSEQQIAALPQQPVDSLPQQEIRAPMKGRVVERKVDLGMAVGRDNLEAELFVIVDLDRVWVDLAVSPVDLAAVKEGQRVVVTTRAIKDKAQGEIVFISPALDKDTRSARVIAEIANPDGIWRPGSFVTAAVAVEEQPASVVVPNDAMQTIGGEKVVFVRTPDGFEKRTVIAGRSDDRFTEIATGLQPGEIIAAVNTFPLKAELLKGANED
jgi:cobalt-zinc-cadmium efflux system membrane fusion protein